MRTTMLCVCAGAVLTLLAAGPVRADEVTVAQMAKSAKEHLDAARSNGEGQRSPYLFGHFLKPPPPPPPENPDGTGTAEAPIVLPPEIVCQGLMNMGGQTVVVMKDGTHRVGETTYNAKITRITGSEVWLLYRGKQFKVPVK